MSTGGGSSAACATLYCKLGRSWGKGIARSKSRREMKASKAVIRKKLHYVFRVFLKNVGDIYDLNNNAI